MYDPITGLSEEEFVEPRKAFIDNSSESSLEDLLKNQLSIAAKLQQMITRDGDSYTSRDLKDLISVSTSLVSSAHKTGETLKELTTYRKFFETVIEFIRQRQDGFGQELLEHLKVVSEEMKTHDTLRGFTR
jgi:hypothetical protein